MSISCTIASTISPSRCGGMFVAIPTAIPAEPLTSRFGKRDGSTAGSLARLVVVRARSRRCRRRCRAASRSPSARAAPRCSASRPAGRRRSSRSCPGRRRAGSAGEGLRHPDERVVDRRVAVRVVLAHHVADGRGGLLVGPVRLQPRLVHAVEDAAVDGLEAVADVGQRAPDDHAHRVVEVARAHLLLELARLDPAAAERFVREVGHQTSRKRTSRAFCFDEGAPRLDLVAHQRREDPVGSGRVLDVDADQQALGRVHRRLPELLLVHLAEALEARELQAFLGELERLEPERAERLRVTPLLAGGEQERRRADDLGQLRVGAAQVGVDRRGEQLGRHGDVRRRARLVLDHLDVERALGRPRGR